MYDVGRTSIERTSRRFIQTKIRRHRQEHEYFSFYNVTVQYIKLIKTNRESFFFVSRINLDPKRFFLSSFFWGVHIQVFCTWHNEPGVNVQGGEHADVYLGKIPRLPFYVAVYIHTNTHYTQYYIFGLNAHNIAENETTKKPGVTSSENQPSDQVWPWWWCVCDQRGARTQAHGDGAFRERVHCIV